MFVDRGGLRLGGVKKETMDGGARRSGHVL